MRYLLVPPLFVACVLLNTSLCLVEFCWFVSRGQPLERLKARMSMLEYDVWNCLRNPQ